MKKNLTELVFILDKSGSMGGLVSDTIGGFNALLQKQRAVAGECLLTTVLFDDKYELLHDRLSIKGVADLTEKDYYVRGSTALLDAVGQSVAKISNAHSHTLSEEVPEKVIMVITTDGMENSSREFTSGQIRELISARKAAGWEFIFLGANLDALETADQMGISRDRAANFHSDSVGTQLNFRVLEEAVTSFRVNQSMAPNWKEAIDEDFEARGKGKKKGSAKGAKKASDAPKA